MLPIEIGRATYEKFKTGQGTASGSAAALTAEPKLAQYGIYIYNLDNTNAIFIGDDTVTAVSGYNLPAETGKWFPIRDPRLIYLITGGASVNYTFFVV